MLSAKWWLENGPRSQGVKAQSLQNPMPGRKRAPNKINTDQLIVWNEAIIGDKLVLSGILNEIIHVRIKEVFHYTWIWSWICSKICVIIIIIKLDYRTATTSYDNWISHLMLSPLDDLQVVVYAIRVRYHFEPSRPGDILHRI